MHMGKHTHHREEAIPMTSSVPLKLPARQQKLFCEVLTLLNEQQLPYAVSGAFALREYTGICRYTKDLDVFLSVEHASQALGCLAERGFECEIRDPVWLAKAYRNGYFVDLITGMSNGVLAVDASWIERAHPASVVGVKTRVLAPEELLASKLFVIRRERFDGADIAHIIYASQGSLKWDRVLELVGEHWEILLWTLILFRYVYPAQTDYVPKELWKELLARLQREVNSPDTMAKFRGSLVDDNMFAIDVNEWGLDNLLQEAREKSPRINDSVAEGCTNATSTPLRPGQ
jgi:hypothetical protein